MAIYLISIRYSENTHSVNTEVTLMAPNNGILTKESNHSVDETLKNLQHTLDVMGVTVFAVVDHSGEAEKVGLKMRPTKLVIFGSPKAGTPLMLAVPSIERDSGRTQRSVWRHLFLFAPPGRCARKRSARSRTQLCDVWPELEHEVFGFYQGSPS
jgi:hypothetical protein